MAGLIMPGQRDTIPITELTAVEIYTATDESVLRSVVKEEKITYILFEEGSEFEQKECQEALISQTFEKVYETEDRRIRIYKTIDDE